MQCMHPCELACFGHRTQNVRGPRAHARQGLASSPFLGLDQKARPCHASGWLVATQAKTRYSPCSLVSHGRKAPCRLYTRPCAPRVCSPIRLCGPRAGYLSATGRRRRRVRDAGHGHDGACSPAPRRLVRRRARRTPIR
jgi:hypothetical protein